MFDVDPIKKSLNEMGVPIVERPEGIDIIMNFTSEDIVSIDDLTTLLSIQYKLNQYSLYLKQQLAIAKTVYNDLEDEFDRMVSNAVRDVKPTRLTLTEKRNIVIQNNEDLANMSVKVKDARRKKTLLEGWIDDVNNLAEVVRQVYYRVRGWHEAD